MKGKPYNTGEKGETYDMWNLYNDRLNLRIFGSCAWISHCTGMQNGVLKTAARSRPVFTGIFLLHETLRDVKYMCGESLYENCCGAF
jgi:hypothetical protein